MTDLDKHEEQHICIRRDSPEQRIIADHMSGIQGMYYDCFMVGNPETDRKALEEKIGLNFSTIMLVAGALEALFEAGKDHGLAHSSIIDRIDRRIREAISEELKHTAQVSVSLPEPVRKHEPVKLLTDNPPKRKISDGSAMRKCDRCGEHKAADFGFGRTGAGYFKTCKQCRTDTPVDSGVQSEDIAPPADNQPQEQSLDEKSAEQETIQWVYSVPVRCPKCGQEHIRLRRQRTADLKRDYWLHVRDGGLQPCTLKIAHYTIKEAKKGYLTE